MTLPWTADPLPVGARMPSMITKPLPLGTHAMTMPTDNDVRLHRLDELAKSALSAMCLDMGRELKPDYIAKTAYDIAAAMLLERGKR